MTIREAFVMLVIIVSTWTRSCALRLAQQYKLQSEIEKHRIMDNLTLETVVNGDFSHFNVGPSKIAIASQCDHGFYACSNPTFRKAFSNHRAYADAHGYEYFLLDTPLSYRFLPWDRYPFITSLFERGAEWVLFVEADALVMNMNVSVEEFVAKHGSGKDLVASGDLNDHYLAGNFLIHNSVWSKDAMCAAWSVCPSPGFDQLGAMMVVLGGGNASDPRTWKLAYDSVWGRGVTEDEQVNVMRSLPAETQAHLALLPQRAMNSYDTDGPNDGFHKGDWIVHFAGRPNKEELVDTYTSKFHSVKPECHQEAFLRTNACLGFLR